MSPSFSNAAMIQRYVGPLWRKGVLLALLIFSTIGLQLVNPQIIGFFIDTAVSDSTQPLIPAALTFLGAALLLQLTSVAATYFSEDIGWRSTNALREDAARHALQLDMAFHNDHTPGEMIERLDGDIADIAIFFSQFIIKIVGNGLLILGVLVILYTINWQVGLAFSIYSIIAFGWLFFLRRIAIPTWKRMRQASADLFSFIEEQLAGTEDIRASGAVSYVMHHLFRLHRVRSQAEIDAASRSLMLIFSWITLYTIGQIIALTFGYFLFQANTITLGTVYIFIAYTDAIYRPLRELTNQIELLQKAAAGLDRVTGLLKLPSRIGNLGEATLEAAPHAITFDSVQFAYDEKQVLQDISFSLAAGEVLGVLGRTGSGKTTLTRLLFRLYEASAGEVRLDDVPLAKLPLAHLRQRVGLVTQEVELFRASVRDNLTFFNPTIKDEQIMSVIRQLGLQTWLDQLSNGLDSELSSEGRSLSAGEGQLLAFARVFLRNPGLVVLDEASSRLDPATEQLIERAVDRLLDNRTGIIVAHRLHTLRRADKILLLENGRIHEFGPYEALANDPSSRFYQLLQTSQSLAIA